MDSGCSPRQPAAACELNWQSPEERRNILSRLGAMSLQYLVQASGNVSLGCVMSAAKGDCAGQFVLKFEFERVLPGAC